MPVIVILIVIVFISLVVLLMKGQIKQDNLELQRRQRAAVEGLCPVCKLETVIVVSGIPGDSTKRCGSCNYPLISAYRAKTTAPTPPIEP